MTLSTDNFTQLSRFVPDVPVTAEPARDLAGNSLTSPFLFSAGLKAPRTRRFSTQLVLASLPRRHHKALPIGGRGTWSVQSPANRSLPKAKSNLP